MQPLEAPEKHMMANIGDLMMGRHQVGRSLQALPHHTPYLPSGPITIQLASLIVWPLRYGIS
jgi:hypothetical protein